MPAADLFRKLGRLVAYKIWQTGLLKQNVVTGGDWEKIQQLFSRENHYAKKVGFGPLTDNYQKAMWAYYELLESVSLKKMNAMKAQVLNEIQSLEVKKKFNLE